MLRRSEIAERYRLTLREQEVVEGVCSGFLNKQIGHRLGISKQTVKVHRAHAMANFDVKTAADLAKFLNLASDLVSPVTKHCRPLD